MPPEEFQEGDRVTFSGGSGEVIKIKRHPGDQSDLLHILTDENEVQKRPASLPNIEKIETSDSLLQAGDFDHPEYFDLRTRASQMDLTHRLDRFVALTNSRIYIVPYQVKAAHEILTSYRHRYLIGDEVGLGKTIEAGIVIEELIARGRADRILIVTPAPLQAQWQSEMQEKFNRDYVIYDRSYFDAQRNAHPSENAWEQEDRIITSIDFAKQDDVLAALRNLEPEWDVAIFDEGHHLTARREGQTGIEKTERYRAGEAVADNSDGLLFLTGTPHKGKSDQFYFMLQLLDPYRFRDEHDLSPDRLDDIMVRRLKDNIYEEDGSPMFPEKNIETLPVHFSDEEQELYEAVTDYISDHYNLATRDESSATGFAMVLYQKRLVSSIHAIKKSLKNRLDALDRAGTDPGELSEVVQRLLPKYRRDPTMLTDAQREEIERELEEVAIVDDPADLDEEREIVQELYNMARQVPTDSKAEELKSFVDGILDSDPDEKILVFTEYTDTLEYLRDEVFEHYRTAEIYGDLSEEQRRTEVEKFREDANLMLATDAAREGLNLQFAHIMVNYDLPWNPIRIDQRIGRLHRYGQEDTVEIRNLFVDETRESDILEVLFEKLDDIEDELGLRSDVLGMVLDDFDLEDQIMNAVARGESPEQIQQEIDTKIRANTGELEEIERELPSDSGFNQAASNEDIQEIVERSKEDTVDSEDVERLVRTFLSVNGGSIRKLQQRSREEDGPVYHLEIPDVLTGERVDRTYDPATFDREVAIGNEDIAFIALEHPLVQSIIGYSKDEERMGGLTAIKVGSENTPAPGMLFNYVIECLDGTGETICERLVRVYITAAGEIRQDPVKLTGGLPPDEADAHEEVQQVRSMATDLQEMALEEAEAMVHDLAEDVRENRLDEITQRRENAERYFEKRRRTLRERLSNYQERQEQGEDDMTALINKVNRKLSDLETEKEEAMARLETERTVTYEDPQPVNAAVVVTGLETENE